MFIHLIQKNINIRIDLGSSDLGFRNIYVSSTPTENNH